MAKKRGDGTIIPDVFWVEFLFSHDGDDDGPFMGCVSMLEEENALPSSEAELAI